MFNLLNFKSMKKLFTLNIFPNPIDNDIRFSGINLVNSRYHIYDINGREKQFGKIADQNVIEVSPLPSGLYFLRIDTGDKLYMAKFIKN